MIDRDYSIASQNAANVAGQIVAAMIAHGGHENLDYRGTFDNLREHIFSGTIALSTVPDGAATTTGAGAGPIAQTAPSGNGHFCKHGPREFVEGNGKKGPWKAWMCPLPQERKAERCEPEWIR